MASETSWAERVIYKHPLNQPLQQIALRAGAVYRHMDVVDGQPVVWIEQPAVASPAPEEVWTLRVVGTGQGFTPNPECRFLGSGRCGTTGLVWHLFLLHVEGGEA
jgi:hypothetical protein